MHLSSFQTPLRLVPSSRSSARASRIGPAKRTLDNFSSNGWMGSQVTVGWPRMDFIASMAGDGHEETFTDLLANGRLILKAVIQRPSAIGRHRPEAAIDMGCPLPNAKCRYRNDVGTKH